MEAMLSWQIGDVRITRVREQEALLPLEGLIHVVEPDRLAGHREWLFPHFLTEAGEIRLSIHALVVESAGRTIVVDTCMGNDRPLPIGLASLQTDFLEKLERVVKRDQVDFVMCTHLHFDHVGWNTMKVGDRFVPTFPNARYLFAREEFDHWATEQGESKREDSAVDLGYSIRPIVEAGLHDLVPSRHMLTDEVFLEPTPGHTPGHVAVRIESRGQSAVITGDLVHHPVQLAEPHWGSHPDVLPERAVETRRAFVARYGDRPVLVIGTHFSGPTAGRIVKVGSSCRFEV
ncbi:MAG: MBL fold metallo-hydrolase [Myxococcota bacterium]